MKRAWLSALSLALAFAVASPLVAAISFDQNVTNNAIFGSGNANGSYTVDRTDGVELGLRAKIRFPAPQNTFLSQGDGTYGSFNTGGPGSNTPNWSFEWSINTNYTGATGLNLDDLTYLLRIDTNPGAAATYNSFDPMDPLNHPNGWWDHSIGTNATANGAGAEATDATSYAALVANNNLAQNSWRMDFFFSPAQFNPLLDGQYDFELLAFRGDVQIAGTFMSVIVGNGAPPVPEPASLVAWGGLALCGGLVVWRRRK